MVAEYNVRQCEARYDYCRNTPDFQFVGQNIVHLSWKAIFDIDDLIPNMINHHFFAQNEQTTALDIIDFPSE